MGVNLFHNKPPPTSIGFSVTTNLVIPRISMRLRIAQNVTHTWEKFLAEVMGKVLLQVREEVNKNCWFSSWMRKVIEIEGISYHRQCYRWRHSRLALLLF